jgi:riboflavin kinase/FMN adenylyltransferase
MEVFSDITDVIKNSNTVVTIGTFDGFHAGHKKIIERVIKGSKNINGRSFAITFEPHPRSVVSKDNNIKILTTLKEKISLLDAAGVENLLVINFTPEFSRLTYEQFFNTYIIDRIGIKELVIGHDHRLGKNRDGDENKLKKLGDFHHFDVIPVDAMRIDGEIVSSTKVRQALQLGHIDAVNKYLGRYYCFSGKVVKGSMRGRQLGFPTANVQLDDENKLIPANGIYVVEVKRNNGKYFGLMNIGLRPTFGDTEKILIEIYILDFDEDIYNEEISVSVIERIRDELKFSSKEDLIHQMNLDKQKGIEIIRNLIN